MAKLSESQFNTKYPRVGPHLLNTSLWNDFFKCPCCGKEHFFSEETIDIAGDIPWNKMLVLCPEHKGVMVLYAKTFLGFGFKGFEVLDWTEL